MRKILPILSFLLLISCSDKKEETPSDILPKEKFISVMMEMYLLEAEISHSNILDQSSYEKGMKKYEKVFKKFGTDKEQVSKSIDHYTHHPVEMREIQSRILDSLNVRSIK